MSVYKGGSLCFHRFKRVRRSGKETLNSYGVTVGFGSSRSANQTDLSKRMLCLEDDSWATDILFLSESDAFSRQPMMELLLENYGKYHSIHRKENIEQTDTHKGIQADRTEYISSDAQMWVVQSYTMNQKLARSYIIPTRRARDKYCVTSVAPKGIEKLITVFKQGFSNSSPIFLPLVGMFL